MSLKLEALKADEIPDQSSEEEMQLTVNTTPTAIVYNEDVEMLDKTSNVNELVKRCATAYFDEYEAGLGTKGVDTGKVPI